MAFSLERRPKRAFVFAVRYAIGWQYAQALALCQCRLPFLDGDGASAQASKPKRSPWRPPSRALLCRLNRGNYLFILHFYTFLFCINAAIERCCVVAMTSKESPSSASHSRSTASLFVNDQNFVQPTCDPTRGRSLPPWPALQRLLLWRKWQSEATRTTSSTGSSVLLWTMSWMCCMNAQRPRSIAL